MKGMSVALLCIMSHTAFAQGSQGAAKSRVGGAVMEAAIYRTLFSGITLTPDQEKRARQVIKEEQAAQEALRPGSPGLWEMRIKLNRTRDSTLNAILKTKQQKEKFEANALPSRPQPRQ